MIANANICSRRLSAMVALAMLAACTALLPTARGQAPGDGARRTDTVRQAGKLAPHRPVERELGQGQTDVFTVDVAAGQFLHVVAEKKGVNAVVTLVDPQGKVLVTAEGPSDAFGQEPASLIADGGGEYQVRVAKSPRSSETGRYRIELTALRAPTERDRTRLRAESEMFAAAIGERAQDGEKRQQAVAGYERAAAVWRSLRDDREEALCLTRLGVLYDSFTETQKALDHSNRALLLRRAAGDRAGEAMTLMNIGDFYSNLGQKQEALGYYKRAFPLAHAVGDRTGEAKTLRNIGIIYRFLGDKQKALYYLGQALDLHRAVGDSKNEGRTLNSIGVVYLNSSDAIDGDLGERRKALEYFDQALTLSQTSADRRGELAALSNIGEVYSNLGEKQKALDYYMRALTLEQVVGFPGDKAETLSNIGDVYLVLGEKRKALDYYTQALRIAGALDPSLQGLILGNLMRSWQAEHHPGLAIFFGKLAVNQYQEIRRNIQGLEQQLQRSYVATVTGTYRSLADLLIGQDRLPEAEQILSLLKEQEYFNYVRRDAAEASAVEGRADVTSEEAEWERQFKKVEKVADRLVTIGKERGDLLAKKTLTPAETLHLDQLEDDISLGNKKFDKFLADLQEGFSDKPVGILRVDQVRQGQRLMEVLRKLPPDTVAIYTVVGEDKLSLILRTPDVQKGYEYPITAADLRRKVRAFREAARDPLFDPRPLGRELYNILVGPMAEDLAKAHTLMWSLDGILRYVPLAALYDGKQYLIERYRLSVMTLASNYGLLDRPDAGWKAAGFGVTKFYKGAPALPQVQPELAGIIGDAGVMPGEVRLDGAFTQKAMREALRKRYPVVHIASHFRLRPGNERESFLLLGDGSHLTLAELETSANWFGGVQLLTLSACDTGVGGMGDGTEVESFGTMAERQGAKAVIASLWAVEDDSTSRLMQRFYGIRQSSRGKTKLQALREAQLELLRGTAKRSPSKGPVRIDPVREPLQADDGSPPPEAPLFRVDPRAPYAHPYYWAPFFLMGNWL